MTSHSIVRLGLALPFLVFSFATNANPLPDHLIYGTIAIDGRPMTRADKNVTVEARRSATGPVIASYRMGATSRLGEFYYALRIPVAASAEASASEAALGEPIVVTVRSARGVAHEVIHQVTEPGVALRLDLGAGADNDGDGVPEGWERATLGTTGADLSRDSDGDGANDRAEYAAGTRPADTSDVFRIAVENDGEEIRVSFRALRATATGLE